MTLQVTQAAITEILRLHQYRQTEGPQGDIDFVDPSAASVSVPVQLDFRAGGCAGQRYQLNFAAASPSFQVVDLGAISLHISPAAWDHVQQLTLDYVEDLMGGSFRFDNPALPQTCNCGQSFRLTPME